MIKLFKHLKPKDWLLIACATVLIGLQVYLDLSIPAYMSSITELIQSQTNTLPEIKAIGIKMVGASLGSVVSAIIVGYIAASISSSFGYTLRDKLYGKVNDFTMHDVGQFSIPSLITRTTTDTSQVQLFVAIGLQIIIKAPILAIASLSRILNQSWQWSLLISVGILFLLAVILIIVIFAIPRFNRVQKLTDNINRILRESLTGISVVRAYNAESYQEEKFEQASTTLSDNNLVGTRIVGLLQPSLNFTMSMLSIGIYWIGAFLIFDVNGLQAQQALFSDMVVYASYALQVIAAFMLLSILFVILPRVKVSAKRISEVLDAPISMADGALDVTSTKSQGTLRFENVSFTYPKAAQPALSNINFSVNQGETIAFIGATGSGKTTLINLIPRLYDVTEGRVFVDDVDVRSYTLESLYERIGYVSQKAMLFSGSIESNLNFGTSRNHTIDADTLDLALQTSQASEFVSRKENGIQSRVAQLGTNFSGGQKQRLNIARAIARQPEILIFDDSFSALDYQTDKTIRQQLQAHAQNVTKVIVAQRIGTIIDADQIVVLDKGRMVGIGKHAELLQSCSIYRDIAASQLSKEELENA